MSIRPAAASMRDLVPMYTSRMRSFGRFACTAFIVLSLPRPLPSFAAVMAAVVSCVFWLMVETTASPTVADMPPIPPAPKITFITMCIRMPVGSSAAASS